MKYYISLIFTFLFIESAFLQNSNCNIFELLPNSTGVYMSNDVPPVPCGFFNPYGTFVNECSSCGHKIADNLCVNSPVGSICELDGFTSMTGGFTPDDIGASLIGFCNGAGTIENNFFIGFTAQTNEIKLKVTVDNCNQSSNQLGLQVAVIETDCISNSTTMQGPNPCVFNGIFNSSEIIHANNLVPGNPYYVMIDGFAGDICEVSLEVLDGFGSPAINIISVSEDLCPDISIPGEPEASVTVELDPSQTTSADLYFYWVDPTGQIIAGGPANLIVGNFFVSSLGASNFPVSGIYSVQIVDESNCCVECTELSLNIVSPNLNITDDPIPDGIYTALYEVESASGVPTSGNVIFQAGDEINLNPGFEVQVSAVFEAEIEVCQ